MPVELIEDIILSPLMKKDTGKLDTFIESMSIVNVAEETPHISSVVNTSSMLRLNSLMIKGVDEYPGLFKQDERPIPLSYCKPKL